MSPGVRVGPSYYVPGDTIWRPYMTARRLPGVTALVTGGFTKGPGYCEGLVPSAQCMMG